MSLANGTRFDRYEIRSLIGKGGMGEVYLAHDTQLRRLVALKLLSSEFASDANRLQRFAREAYTASALNHPNIITVYEIGRVDSIPFLSMEYVDGESLRQRMKRAPVSQLEALEICIQIGEALAVAHASNIVHRDVKPENIMLRRDRYLKVLDFGLAKFTQALPTRMATPDASTVTNLDTGKGIVIGTTSYMSPEQLRGLQIDARTDIWSLGVILYEMLTRELPFRGHNTAEVIVSILEREPSPLSEHVAETQPVLGAILEKALQKDRELRYETVQELLADLKSLRRSIAAEAGPAAEASGASVSGRERGERAADRPERAPVSAAGETDPARTRTDPAGRLTHKSFVTNLTSGLSHLLKRVNHPLSYKIVLVSAFVLAVCLGYLGYRFASRFDDRESPAQAMEIYRLMLSGDVRDAALSPDGKYLSTILSKSGKQTIVVRELANASEIEVVSSETDQFQGITFSPDGSYLYYLKKELETGSLYRVPKLGGSPYKLLANVNTTVTFSPDGKQMAFARYDKAQQSTALMTALVDGTGEKAIVSLRPPEMFALGQEQVGGPAWSPDGRTIACAILNMTSQLRMYLAFVDVNDGSLRRHEKLVWAALGKLAWLMDGTGVVVNGAMQASAPMQVWLVSWPDVAARKITNDANFHENVGLNNDSTTLMTVQSDQLSTIWVVPKQAAERERARQLSASRFKGTNGIAWSADGKIIYTSNESGNQDIWSMALDGTNRKQLTFNPQADIQPDASKDGRFIAFTSYRTGVAHVWRMDSDGSNLKQLTHGSYEDTPHISPDAKWVIYHSIESKDSVWRVPIDGGEPERLSEMTALQPVVSPDGRMVAFFSSDGPPGQRGGLWKLALATVEGGQVLKWFELSMNVDPAGQTLKWAADGQSLTYVVTDGGVSNIWQQDLKGSPPQRKTDFLESQIFSFNWAPDGNQMVCVRGSLIKDVILMKNFR
jgi:eukaryotic-like serine/threonine-protein kinase